MRLSHLFAVAIVVIATPAQAAELTFLDKSYAEYSDKPVGAVILVQGDIVEGDSKRLEALLSQIEDFDTGFYESVVRLALNSPGGSYDEGLKIGSLIRDKGVGTMVPEGAQCYSACAIIFMHGTVHLDYEKWLNRKLHPAGRVGFHAPYLELMSNVETSPEMVAAAYSAALIGISELIESARTIFSEELLMKMLRVPPDQVLLVETYGDLFTWEIALDETDDMPIKSLTRAQMVLACETIDALRNNRRPNMTLERAAELAKSEYSEPRMIGTVDGDEIYRYPVNDMNEVGCNLGISKKADGSLRVRYYGDSYGNKWSDSPLPTRYEWSMSYRYFKEPSERFLK